MQHAERAFIGVRGARIVCQEWLPDGDPRAVLVLVHGLAEHCCRYGNLVDHFVPRGFAVHGHDHIGHGRSGGRRVFVRRFEDLTEVLDLQIDRVRARHPAKPLFLIGHSLGALIASRFLLDRQEATSGAVLSGALVKIPPSISALTVAASKVLSVLAPTLGVAAVDAQGVSRDPAVVRAYIDDPLVYSGKTTARMGAEMLRAMRTTLDAAGEIRLPVLILHGGADRLVDPDSARSLHEQVGSIDKTLMVYEGLHHEIYNEPERDRVLKDVERWIAARVASRPADAP